MSKDNKKGFHNFQMDALYIEALMEILVFAAQTAAYMAHKEVADGRTGKDLIKLARLTNDSNEIIRYFKESIEIGKPTSDLIN